MNAWKLAAVFQRCGIVEGFFDVNRSLASTMRPSVGGALIGTTSEKAIAQGILFAGTPDTVYKQIMDFYDFVGGYGHLVMIGRSGVMTHAETEKSIDLSRARCCRG